MQTHTPEQWHINGPFPELDSNGSPIYRGGWYAQLITTRETPLAPGVIYGRTKRECERIAKMVVRLANSAFRSEPSAEDILACIDGNPQRFVYDPDTDTWGFELASGNAGLQSFRNLRAAVVEYLRSQPRKAKG